MVLVVPAAFALTTGIFGALNGIAAILLSMRKSYKGWKKLHGLLDEADEGDIRLMIPVAEVKVLSTALLETMVPLLEATARTVPDIENMEEHRRLLTNVRHVFGAQVLKS